MRARIIFIIPAVLAALVNAGGVSARTTISLNGTWQFQPVASLETSIAADWESIQVPGLWTAVEEFEYPPEWRDIRSAWYQRVIVLPDSVQGQRILLKIGPVAGTISIFLNDQPVFSGGILSTVRVLDITDLCRFTGEETLRLGIAADDGWAGLLGDVLLEIVPPVYISGLRVEPTKGGREIQVWATIRNEDTIQRFAEVRATVPDERVGNLASSPTPIPAGQSREIRISAPWAGARLWRYDKPALYTMDLQLFVGRQLVDSRQSTFGVHIVAVSGARMTLNGAPVALFSINYPLPARSRMVRLTARYLRTAFREFRRLNINTVRLPWQAPALALDIADAMGTMIIRELPADAAAIAAQVSQERGHPSIVAWALPYRGEHDLGGWQQAIALQEAVRRHDANRPVLHAGGNGLGGLAGIRDIDVDPRYIDRLLLSANASRPVSVTLAGGIMRVVPQQWAHEGGDGVYRNLFDWFPGLRDVRGATLSRALASLRRQNVFHVALDASLFRWFELEGDFPADDESAPGLKPRHFVRDDYHFLNAGFHGVLPPVLPGVISDKVREVLAPVQVIIHPHSTAISSGDVTDLTLTFLNNTARRESLKFTLQTVPRMAALQRIVSVTLPPGGTSSVPVRVQMPDVAEPALQAYHWTLTHSRGDTEGDLQYSVYPRHIGSTESRKVHILQRQLGSGLVVFLSGMGYSVETAGSPAAIPAQGTLLIGPGDGTDPSFDPAAVLAYVRSGGTAIIMEQPTLAQVFQAILPGWEGLEQEIADYRYFAADYREGPFAAVLDGDLASWGRLHPVETRLFTVPPRGNFHIRAWTANRNGDTRAAVLEIPVGSGRLVLSQLPLLGRWADDVAAQVLLESMVAFAATPPILLHKGHLVGTFSQNQRRFLGEIGLQGQTVSGDMPRGVFLSGSSAPASMADLAAQVRAGGTLIVLDPDDAGVQQTASLLGIAITAQDYRGLHQQGEIVAASPILSGIQRADLIWEGAHTIAKRGLRSDGGRALIAEPAATAPMTEAEGLGALLYRASARWESTGVQTIRDRAALLVEYPLGEGRVIISQIQMSPGYGKSSRFYSQLFTNLGVRLHR